MEPEQYRMNPCEASSLPFWKTNCVTPPPSVRIVRDDLFSGPGEGCTDTPFFKLIHRLGAVSPARLPDGFSPASVDERDMAAHIALCYVEERVSAEELSRYKARSVYSPDLWIGLRENASGLLAATGIAEFDQNTDESSTATGLIALLRLPALAEFS